MRYPVKMLRAFLACGLLFSITCVAAADESNLTDAQQKKIWKEVAEARGKALDVRTAADLLQQKQADAKTAEERATALIKEFCPASGSIIVDPKTSELSCAPPAAETDPPPPAK